MADPFSIAASLTGLLAVAGKITTVLCELVSSAAHASQSVRVACASVEEMKLVLESTKQLLDNGLSSVPDQRKRMINISNLIVVFRQSIISLSEMEALVNPAIGPDGRILKWKLLKWTVEKEDFAQCLRRVESHKASLIAMLSILQCQSEIIAAENMRSLQNAVQLVLQQNQDILYEIEQYNIHLGTGNASVRFLDDDVSTIRPPKMSGVEPASISHFHAQSELTFDGVMQAGLHRTGVAEEFETILYETRVYQRAQSNQCDVSLSSSAVLTHAWSALSELSLSDVSVVSVVALPLSLENVTSIGPNLTFSKILASYNPETTKSREVERTNASSLEDYYGQSGIPVLRKAHPPLAGLGLRQPIDLNTTASMPVHKIVMLGGSGVGKTALMSSFCLNGFVETYDPTIEESFRRKAQIDGKSCLLEILDTAGDEDYVHLREQWIRDGDAFLVVYSIGSRNSFHQAHRLADEVSRVTQAQKGSLWRLPAIMLVSNKCDRVREREVATLEGSGLAKHLECGFIEASSKTGINVETAFYEAVRMVRQGSPRNPTSGQLAEHLYNPKKGLRRWSLRN